MGQLVVVYCILLALGVLVGTLASLGVMAVMSIIAIALIIQDVKANRRNHGWWMLNAAWGVILGVAWAAALYVRGYYSFATLENAWHTVRPYLLR